MCKIPKVNQGGGGNKKWGGSCLGVPTIAHVPKIGIHSITLLSVPKSAIVPPVVFRPLSTMLIDKSIDGALVPTKEAEAKAPPSLQHSFQQQRPRQRRVEQKRGRQKLHQFKSTQKKVAKGVSAASSGSASEAEAFQ